MENVNFLEKLGSQFGQNASVKNVFGEPIRAGEKTIIPVARIAYGLGGGYGEQKQGNTGNPESSAEETSRFGKKRAGEGAGGGGGLVARPIGVYEVTAAQTRFVPASNIRPLLLGICIGFLLRGRLRKRK